LRTPSRFPHKCALLLLVVLMIPGALFAQGDRLKLIAYAAAYGGSCEPGYPNVVAGSTCFLGLEVVSSQPAPPWQTGWPEGFGLEAALDLPQDQPFVCTPGLFERLEPSPYRSGMGGCYQCEVLPPEYVILNRRFFALHIPPDFVGHTLTFHAVYQWEGLSLESMRDNPLSIIAPCDRNDSARIVGSRIFQAWDAEDYARAMKLADSMLVRGLSDAVGWQCAQMCAQKLQRTDKAKTYSDRMIRDFGNVRVRFTLRNAPTLNPVQPSDSVAQEGIREKHK
jgi:hypothetical protein